MWDNPCMKPEWDVCAFYTEEIKPGPGRYGHCLVMQADRQYDRVRDRFGNPMTKEQILWFEANCPDWPARDSDIRELVQNKWRLPVLCGYVLVGESE